MKNKDKQAGTKLLSIWWFFVIVVVFTGVVMGVSFFKENKIDARTAEAAVLMNRVIGCSHNYGIINERIFVSQSFFDICSLNSQVINTNNYFIKITEINISSEEILKQIKIGNNAFEEECKIAYASTANKYPRCVERNISLVLNNEIVKLNIVTGSNYEFGVA
jgi:hypothetical protein